MEQQCERLFLDKGYISYNYSEIKKHPEKIKGHRYVLLKNVPYITIYGSVGHTEFVAWDTKTGRKVRIECKYQKSAGSVDEKLPYLYLNAVFRYPEKEVIILIEGDGFKKGAKEWLKEQVNKNWLNFRKNKKITVANFEEFKNIIRIEF